MAISATFVLQNVPANADIIRQAVASMLPNWANGVVQVGDFPTTQTGTPSMGVSVGVGRAWIEGTDSAHLTGQTYGKQGKYFVLNDAAYPVSIATADNTNPRIDVIYVAVQDAVYAGSNNQAVIAVATGVPAAGATYPANAQTLPNNAVPLAWINVPANATSILTSYITSLITAPIGVGCHALGLLSRTSTTSNSGTIGSSFVVVSNVASYTFRAGRKYRIGWDFAFQTAAANAPVNVLIATCPTTDTPTQTTDLTQLNGRVVTTPVASQNAENQLYAYVEPTSDTTLQIKWVANSASSNCIFTAAPTNPNYFTIEDLGAQF